MPVHGVVHARDLARTTGESQICAVPPLLGKLQLRGLIIDLGGQAFCIPRLSGRVVRLKPRSSGALVECLNAADVRLNDAARKLLP